MCRPRGTLSPVSPRTLLIAGVLLLAVLGVRAAFVPRPAAEPAVGLPTPHELDLRLESPRLEPRRNSHLDQPVTAQDAAGDERQGSQMRFVEVRVRRPDGKPVSGATVSKGRIALPSRPHSQETTPEPSTTDASGRATLAVPEFHGVYLASKGTEIGIGLPMWDDGSPIPITLVPAATADIEVVDSAGRAVPDAAVSALVVWHSEGFFPEFVRARDGGMVTSNVLVAWSVRTDPSGLARLARLPPADWEPPDDILGGSLGRRVLIEAEGFRSTHTVLADGPNRIVLTAAAEYRAHVVDEYGRAIHEPAWTSGRDVRGWGDEEGRVVALVPDAGPGAKPPPLVFDAAGYLPRTFEATARAPAVVELGTVVLRSAVMLRGTVSYADGTPAGGVIVTANHETAYRVFVQGLTASDGTFALEPPSEGAYRVDAGTPGAPQRGSTRNSLWDAVTEHVLPGTECRLVLHFVPGLLVRLVPPDPKLPGFSLDTVSIIPRSSDGLGQYDWMPEGGGRYLVRLFGRGPWNVEVRHRMTEPVDFMVRDALPGPADDVLTHEVALRAAVR